MEHSVKMICPGCGSNVVMDTMYRYRTRQRRIPTSYYAYELSYPQEMVGGLAGIVFYVGMGTNDSGKASFGRLHDHQLEAARGSCNCDRCQAIWSIWDAGLLVVRRIVFESLSAGEVEKEENKRIKLHQSPYLTNKRGNEYKAPEPPAIIEPVKEEAIKPVRTNPPKKRKL